FPVQCYPIVAPASALASGGFWNSLVTRWCFWPASTSFQELKLKLDLRAPRSTICIEFCLDWEWESSLYPYLAGYSLVVCQECCIVLLATDRDCLRAAYYKIRTAYGARPAPVGPWSQ